MPKLSPENHRAAEAAEGGAAFKPLPAGEYVLRLTEVEAKRSAAGNPMWVWKFEVNEGPHKGSSLWEHTVIQDNALWKIKQVFEAFGASTDTNTDDLIGHTVVAMVDLRVIGAGKRKGEEGNEIAKYFTPEADAKPTAGAKGDEPLPF